MGVPDMGVRAMRQATLALLVVLGACAPLWVPSLELPGGPVGVEHPVVFVPGVTGSKLLDPRDGSLIWGRTAQLLRPRDGGYRLALPLAVGGAAGAQHPQALYRAIEPLWQMRLPGWSKPIYRPLVEHFARAGYPYGDLDPPDPGAGLLFFDYDWRRSNLESVRRLDAELEALRVARGGELAVDLICQSNAGKICRYLLKFGAAGPEEAESGARPDRRYSIRKIVFVGASNNGALRGLELLLRGRSYLPLVGRRLLPEVLFTIRPLFEDLPAERDDLFFDQEGRTLPVDVFDAAHWVEYGWSVFDAEVAERLARRPNRELFGDREEQIAYLSAQLANSGRVQRLLTRDAAAFPTAVRYYRLENRSAPTLDRALLTQVGGRWRTFFLDDKEVAANPLLAERAAAPGDGHATLTSQRHLSPQEESALAGATLVEGGHFEMVIEPAGLEALVRFLED